MRNGWKAVGIKLNGIFNKNIYVMTDKEKAIALFSESIILQDKEAGAITVGVENGLVYFER